MFSCLQKTHVLMFSCLQKKHVLLFLCLQKQHVLMSSKRESYSIARIVLNRTIDVFGCCIFAHVIPQLHVQLPSASPRPAPNCPPCPARIFESALANIRNAPHDYSKASKRIIGPQRQKTRSDELSTPYNRPYTKRGDAS